VRDWSREPFGALLFSLVPALATTAVTPQARGRAMGLITTLGPLGLISGPGLGGMVVDALGWRWIFFVNVPVSVLIIAVGLSCSAQPSPRSCSPFRSPRARVQHG
jgi:MFS family permease